ncbi:MAG: DUF2927 domain-containing protein [Pseudomonadota bacterium]
MSMIAAPLAAAWLALACNGCETFHPGEAWQGYERTALALGKMRLDRQPPGLPVSRQALADNFRRIAFGIENDVLQVDDPIASEGGRLRRWRQPVRVRVTSLGAQAATHRAAVDDVLGRLAEATGHEIRVTQSDEPANLAVMFLRPQDYEPAARLLSQRPGGGWIANQVVRFGKARHTPCVGIFLHAKPPAGTGAQAARRPDEILFALALIRSGLPPRLARACVEEELAQAMGLPNDDPHVRPSVFNDDQEFALLTGHDEALLRILYDNRLSVGMTETEAMEIVPDIIKGLDTTGFDGRTQR